MQGHFSRDSTTLQTQVPSDTNKHIALVELASFQDAIET